MKNVFKVLGIIALVTVIGLSFAGCDTGGGATPAPAGGPGGQAAPQKTVYTWVAGDDSYSLEIKEASNSRAAYTPKSGDTYVLTINPGNKKSSGTVAVSGYTFTLTPTGASTTFTITVTKTNDTTLLVTGMTGTITLEGGTETVNVSDKQVTPVKVFETFSLKAEKWDNIQAWYNDDISLSDLTPVEPKKGDKLKFKISGKMDKPLEWFSVGLSSRIDLASEPWFEYRFLGAKENYIEKLDANFTNYTFVIEILDDPIAPNTVKFGIRNILWQKGDGDNSDWVHDSGLTVKDSDVGKVMCTIKNFEIRLEPNKEED
jgi:predicted RNA-binding protein with TRAM domain